MNERNSFHFFSFGVSVHIRVFVKRGKGGLLRQEGEKITGEGRWGGGGREIEKG